MTTPEAMRAKIEQLKKDGYRIDTDIHPGHVVVKWKDRVVAESDRAVILKETRHAPVIYVPREDARMSILQRTTHTTHCPFKGDANYFTLVSNGDRAENAVWTYESPIPDVAAIAGHLAFYTEDMGAHFGIHIEM